MDIVFVIDLRNSVGLGQRKRAFEDVKNVCTSINASCHHVQFEQLDAGEPNTLESLYNADVALVDLSIALQMNGLFYHLGVRESFGMKQNILTYNMCDTELAKRLRLPCAIYPFATYGVLENGSSVANVAMPNTSTPEKNLDMESWTSLEQNLNMLLKDFEIQSKAHKKEKFLSDLRKARESLSEKELSTALQAIRKRLDDPNVISGETVYNMLLSFRDIQDYNAMINLVDFLVQHKHEHHISSPRITYIHAFALNRRNSEGDRDKALSIVTKLLENDENQHALDLLCFCGRIHKDKFVESGYTDLESLHNAIHWYRKGFEVQPNEYAGINLATLLVVDGKEFSECAELQHIGMVLNNLIGKKGSLLSLQDYWNVATFFEISVLAKNYDKAIQAAECMFKLKPPNWYLKSTLRNISLINQFRMEQPEETIFHFWIEYFVEATKKEIGGQIKIPVLIMEPTRVFIPSYITLNLEDEEKSMQISNLCGQQSKCERMKHNWTITAEMIKSVSLYKRDDRCIFLYIHESSDDFQIYFPNTHYGEHFYNLVQQLTADKSNT